MDRDNLYIEIIAQDGNIWRAPLHQDRIIVGRSPLSSDLVVNDPRVSRVHLQINCDGMETTITDLRSANGTHLENYLLPPNVPISWMVDQTATIGDTKLILRRGYTAP